MKTLTDIFNENTPNIENNYNYFTDKSPPMHYYLEYYEKEFYSLKDRPIDLLEIGVNWGGSMVLWSNYFTNPNTKFYGLDISDANFNHPIPMQKNNEKLLKDNRIKFILDKSSTDKEYANTYEDNSFDVILDDGEHHYRTQFETFKNYFPKLKKDGKYYIEDVLGDVSVERLKELILKHTNNNCVIEEYYGGVRGWRVDDIIIKVTKI